MRSAHQRRRRRPLRQRGGALLVAVLVMATGAVGIASWVTIVSARARYSDEVESSVRRRVVLSNSRAMAQEYIYRNVLTEVSGAAADLSFASTADPTDLWGSFTMGAFDTPPLRSIVLAPGFNRMSPAGTGYGYYVALDVTLRDGTDDDNDGTLENMACRFYAKSRSPLLASEALVVSRSAASPNHNIEVAADGPSFIAAGGRTLYQFPHADHAYGNRTQTYATAYAAGGIGFAPSTAAGGVAELSNFPTVPMTSGKSGLNLGYDGTLDVIDNPAHPHSAKAKLLAEEVQAYYEVILVEVDEGSGPVNVLGVRDSAGNQVPLPKFGYDGGDPDLDSDNNGTDDDALGLSQVDNGNSPRILRINLRNPLLGNILVSEGVDQIEIVGQRGAGERATAANRSAIMLVVAQTTDLTTVDFYHQNLRRFYVAIKEPTYSVVSWNWMEADQASGVPERLDYRLLLTVENVDLDFSFPGSVADVHILGGLRLDRRVIAGDAAEKTYLDPEIINPFTANTAAAAERYADRVAWLESYLP